MSFAVWGVGGAVNGFVSYGDDSIFCFLFSFPFLNPKLSNIQRDFGIEILRLGLGKWGESINQSKKKTYLLSR